MGPTEVEPAYLQTDTVTGRDGTAPLAHMSIQFLESEDFNRHPTRKRNLCVGVAHRR